LALQARVTGKWLKIITVALFFQTGDPDVSRYYMYTYFDTAQFNINRCRRKTEILETTALKSKC